MSTLQQQAACGPSSSWAVAELATAHRKGTRSVFWVASQPCGFLSKACLPMRGYVACITAYGDGGWTVHSPSSHRLCALSCGMAEICMLTGWGCAVCDTAVLPEGIALLAATVKHSLAEGEAAAQGTDEWGLMWLLNEGRRQEHVCFDAKGRPNLGDLISCLKNAAGAPLTATTEWPACVRCLAISISLVA